MRTSFGVSASTKRWGRGKKRPACSVCRGQRNMRREGCFFGRKKTEKGVDKTKGLGYNRKALESAVRFNGELCKGSTTDSDSVCEGSNPSPAASSEIPCHASLSACAERCARQGISSLPTAARSRLLWRRLLGSQLEKRVQQRQAILALRDPAGRGNAVGRLFRAQDIRCMASRFAA